MSGFELAFRDAFDGPEFGPEWGVYQRAPQGADKYDGALSWISSGRAHFRSEYNEEDGKWRSGGAALKVDGAGQVYGSFRARLRLDPGAAFRGVALLWPDGGEWPPEIDFFEIGGSDPDRLVCTQTLHYGADNRMIHTSYTIPGSDFTGLHTVRVDWTPGNLAYYCDAVPRASVVNENVPSVPMHLALQSGVSKDPAPSASDPGGGLHVEWAEVWRYVP